MSERLPGLSLLLDDVTCRYRDRPAVRAAGLRVAPGEHMAIIGAGGSGKSTLLRAILGLHREVGGEIIVGGRAARRAAEWAVRRRQVAWIPQRRAVSCSPLRARDLLAGSGDELEAIRAAADLGLSHLLDRPLSELPAGQAQRVFVARALGQVAAGAGVLLADEPASALDPAGRRQVIELLARTPVTVLIASRDKDVLRACGHAAEMTAGLLRRSP